MFNVQYELFKGLLEQQINGELELDWRLRLGNFEEDCPTMNVRTLDTKSSIVSLLLTSLARVKYKVDFDLPKN